MAGNFWLSSHNQQWILTEEELASELANDLKTLSEEEYRKLQIFFSHFIQSLGECLKLRQQVIATATVYFKRFYSRTSLKCVDPLLLAPTCLYVASKVEECGLMSNTRLLNACNTICKNKYNYAYPMEYPYRINQILECEFYLLEIMDCCLIVFHPYRPLTKYVSDMAQEGSILPYAWRVVNDSLRSDVSLLYPPYMIALAAIYMACVFEKRDCQQWFSELNVNMERILEIVRRILSLYEIWRNFDEKKEVPGLLMKMPKPKCNPGSRPSSATPMSRQHTPSPNLC
ncbi:cyclin-C-like [Hydractinia symbiolongicarpus]|uniref:cyclin-C-like n=1 Tax=Hydractinia symbiolongicarpus TaxID=13093 RepID=UPI00254AB9AB|nr:cyclin-C-like [Hydractinia symbiolongicarpus]